ncbi:MAG TPA: iron ABC transporter permease [Polyangiales bacterium]|nr:iron ABC transporter permease [Polyangiales bacterium]
MRLYPLLILLLIVAGALAVLVGSGDLSDPELRDTFLKLRGYRLAAAFLAGAALAVGGVVVQGLFRNPLASPSVLGTTAGASFGGQVALLAYGVAGVGTSLVVPEMIVPIGCFIGALAALAILLLFLRITEDLLALLLTGFVLSALFLSLSAFVTSIAQETWELGRAVVSFSLGSVSGTGPRQLAFALPLVMTALLASWFWGRSLDLLLSGEEEAQAMGANVGTVRWWSAIWVSVLVAGAVSVGGNVGFVGLVVPHMLRPFTGTKHQRLIPAAALAGGTFLVACDIIARVIPSRSEIPLGVVTGLIGAPLFLLLLVRLRRERAYA